MSRYKLMAAKRANFPIALMARVLEISRSGFYSWLSRPAPTDPWAKLRVEIERIWLDSKKRFGARLIHGFAIK